MLFAVARAAAEDASGAPPTAEPGPALTPAAEPTPVPAVEPTPVPAARPAPAPIAALPASAPASESAFGTTARVSMQVDYPSALLELRRFGTYDAWRSGCIAPCNRRLLVDGMEVRVVAPGMTPSKPFRIASGSGSALLAVDGGSASAHRWGRTALFCGIPLSFAGMGLLGYGTLDDRTALTTSGTIVLGLGAALVLAALPLLASGSTEVTNADGDLIGERRGPRWLY